MALDYSMESSENDRNDFLLQQMERYKFDIPIKVTIKVEEEEKDYCQEYFGNPLNELQNQFESLSNSKNYFDKTNTSNSECFKNCTVDDITSRDMLRSSSSNCINIFDEKIEIESTSKATSNSEYHKSCTLDNVASRSSNREQSSPSNDNTISEKKNKFTSDKDMAINKIQLITLLDRLSENLIQLSKYSYEANISYKHDAVTYETAKEKYSKTKCLFFHLSYRTVTAVILPQEKNQTFIQKFIKRTIAIAHTKSWYCISEELLLYNFKEMIYWVKQRNKTLESQSKQFTFSVLQETDASLPGMPTSTICIENASHDLNTDNKQTKKRTGKSRTFVNKTNSNSTFKFANSAPKRRKTTESISSARSITKHLNKRRNSLRNSKLRDNLSNDNLERRKQTRDVMLNTNISCHVSNMSRNSGFQNSTHNLQPPVLLSLYKNDGKSNIEENSNTTTSHNTISSNKNSVLVKPCSVCQTMTHKMCVGCYKLYYCTLTCQSMDWAVHKNICGGVVIQ